MSTQPMSVLSHSGASLEQKMPTLYPSLSLTKLFADLGGSLGLWLGVGIVQLFVLVLDASKLFRRASF